MLMMRTKDGTVVLDWRGWNRKDPKKLYEELLWQDRKLLEDFEKRERETAESLLTQVETQNQHIPPEAYRGLLVFRNREYEQKPGMLTRLYMTGKDWRRLSKRQAGSKRSISPVMTSTGPLAPQCEEWNH
jgi:hypothetical protein